jgi:hypothetical protein
VLVWIYFIAIGVGQAGAVPVPPVVVGPELRLELAVGELIEKPGSRVLLNRRRIRELVTGLNEIWGSCGIRFRASQSVVRVSAGTLPFYPRTQDDLSKIASRFHPSQYRRGRVPLTLAGDWSRLEPSGGMKLHGLGWAFYSPREDEAPWRIERIGAFVAREQISSEGFFKLAAHELGHALSLGHSADPSNVMAGGDQLTAEQCAQVRTFIERAVIPASRPTLAARSLER